MHYLLHIKQQQNWNRTHFQVIENYVGNETNIKGNKTARLLKVDIKIV